MANRCKTVEGAQQCVKARHPKIKGHTLGPKGETKEWNADGTPKIDPRIAAAPIPDVAEEERRRLAFQKAPAWAIAAGWENPDDTGQLPRRDAARFAKQELAEDDTIVLPDPPDPRLEVEALSDLAVATIHDRAFLVDLAVRTFEFEAAACEDATDRLAAEIEGRDRFLVLAAAAKTAGHHPFTAYCFVADRLDPVATA